MLTPVNKCHLVTKGRLLPLRKVKAFSQSASDPEFASYNPPLSRHKAAHCGLAELEQPSGGG